MRGVISVIGYQMPLSTPLHSKHLDAGAKMVDFEGWDMPLHYGSLIAEHRAVRSAAGVFDVSHMGIVDIEGKDARPYLRCLLANDIGKLSESGHALYGCMLNERGGVVDDLITYFCGDTRYRIVVNAGTRRSDLAWMREHIGKFRVELREREGLAMLALQGPQARALAAPLLPEALKGSALELSPFTATEYGSWFCGRTGYTGEDGWEIIMPSERAPGFWDALMESGFVPCGLGARDTLRLEAGLNLYGQDMDQSTHPFESNLGWTVAFEPIDREFIGRKALEKIRRGGWNRRLVGLVLLEGGVLRHGQRVNVETEGSGIVTSGTYGPTVGRSIALARLPQGNATRCQVNIRGRDTDAKIVAPPFVRKGKVRVELK